MPHVRHIFAQIMNDRFISRISRGLAGLCGNRRKATLDLVGVSDMYAGAIAVIVALGCVAELLEVRAEKRRSEAAKSKREDFPGLRD